MKITAPFYLPKRLRVQLKKPFGKLLKGDEDEVGHLLKKNLRVQKPTMIISVGDKVTSTFNSLGVIPNLFIYDGKTKRNKVLKTCFKCAIALNVKNPAGMITEEALNLVKLALKSNVTVGLRVDGEEDLLTLPVIRYAPIGALVAYGQPDEGIVIVKVTKNKKASANNIMNKMRVIG